MAQEQKSRASDAAMDRLKSEALGLIGALGDRAVSSVRGKVEDAAGRLTDYVDGGAGPGIMAAVTGVKDLAEGKSPVRALLGAGTKAVANKLRGQGGGKGQNLKVTNIVESIDVGAPIGLTYNLWTQYPDFPSFMKKVESVEQSDDGDEEQKHRWKAQILWSHRTWESTIVEQAPDDKIIWRSEGAKGHVDGAVTFHELAPNLTRVLLVLEYYPQGFFEHTGNIWRAQGRRVRLELKHFRRHLMAEVLLHPDEIEGWRGVVKDGEVVQDHEAAGGEEPGERGRDGGRDGEPRSGEDEDERDFDAEDEFEAEDEPEDEPEDEARDDGRVERDREDDAGRFAGNGRRARRGEAARAPGRGHEHAPPPDGERRPDRAGRRPQRERGRRGTPVTRGASQ
jgi:uncharacterized membrane protein